jgi:menaquinone-dependent protoporphyrinogen oxidase
MSLNDSEKQEEVKVYMDKPKALLTPASEAVFAGVMDLSKLKLIERLMMKAMKSPIGDFRDWDAIHGWSKELTAKLGLAV